MNYIILTKLIIKVLIVYRTLVHKDHLPLNSNCPQQYFGQNFGLQGLSTPSCTSGPQPSHTLEDDCINASGSTKLIWGIIKKIAGGECHVILNGNQPTPQVGKKALCYAFTLVIGKYSAGKVLDLLPMINVFIKTPEVVNLIAKLSKFLPTLC
jgi:hypothetical protein